MEVLKILNASCIYWTPVACSFFLQVTLRNNNLGAHVPAHNHSALMLAVFDHQNYAATHWTSIYIYRVLMLHFELLFTISFHTNLCHPTSLLNFGSWASSWLQCKFQQNNQLRHKGDWKTIWGLWLVAALYRGNCWWTLRSACNYLSPVHVVPNSPPPSTQHDSAYLSPYKIDKFQASFALYRFFFGCFFFSTSHEWIKP